ncbi:MAG: SUMF1/EgtB/PvdO family nonheme iron enzyme [Verrucomicrobiota bacterium]
MKRMKWMPGLLLMGTLAVQAGNLAIQSFDSSGKVTFNELTTAVGYRAEWTTNLLSTSWSSNAPGIPFITPLGAGSISVTVGVASVSCFYRVVATVSNPPGMVLIPAGSFVMGNATNVFPEYRSDELPPHTVYLSAFYMDRHEVTFGLWSDVTSWATNNGYSFTNASSGKAITNYPVHTVNWYDMVKWCNARSQKEGLTPCYYISAAQSGIYTNGELNISNSWVKWSANGYRLPTEAEWEKAARGGVVDARFPWSDYTNKISHAKANYYGYSGTYSYDLSTGPHPTYATGGYPYSSPVGSFAPNEYGLYDMAGNMWEWVWDWYDVSYYSHSPGTNPAGPTSGGYRVLRGGSWVDNADGARCANRWDGDKSPDHTDHSFGFRCARGL